MNLPAYLRGRQWWWIAIAAIYLAVEFEMAYSEPRSCRPNDPQAVLGQVYIDLAKLHYNLKFADLQAAGMFTGIDCENCDFSRAGYIPLACDNQDQHFIGVLGKGAHRLTLVFYGRDLAAGRQRFEQSVEALRARFSDRSEAFHRENPWGERKPAEGSKP